MSTILPSILLANVPRIAGSDTSSISLSYFLWELSRRPDVAAKLQTELDEAMPNAHVIPDISVLQSLPYLNAFIKEGLYFGPFICQISRFNFIKVSEFTLRLPALWSALCHSLQQSQVKASTSWASNFPQVP